MVEFANGLGVRESRIEGDLLEILKRDAWPGNIRELRNVAERVTILSRGAPIGRAWLPRDILETVDAIEEPTDFQVARRQFEVDFLRRHLDRNNGKVGSTPREIGMHPVSLRQKLAKLGVRNPASRC